MLLISDEREYSYGASAVALGMFDGVHIGHRSLISLTVSAAREEAIKSVVCTFDKHPLSVIAPERAPEPLTGVEERLSIFDELGVDCALVKPFTFELAETPPEAFVESIVNNLRARIIVCGRNYTFGSRGSGNAALLKEISKSLGFRLVIAPDVYDNGELVSSTLIRALICAGDKKRAEKLLGR